MLRPNLKSHKQIWQTKPSYLSTVLQSLWRNQGFEDCVCVSEKCYLLQESEHMTRTMVRLQNVSELGSSGRSGKICMTYQLLCWEHQVRKARWRGKWIWAGKEIKLADLEYTEWIGTKKWQLSEGSNNLVNSLRTPWLWLLLDLAFHWKVSTKQPFNIKTDLDFICT